MSKNIWDVDSTDDVPERPLTIHEMVLEITEYHINNMSWADIKEVLEQYYAHYLASMPPEALQEAYDGIFNR